VKYDPFDMEQKIDLLLSGYVQHFTFVDSKDISSVVIDGVEIPLR
jgi:hypothetical protein